MKWGASCLFQIAFLRFGFWYLVIITDYRGKDEITERSTVSSEAIPWSHLPTCCRQRPSFFFSFRDSSFLSSPPFSAASSAAGSAHSERYSHRTGTHVKRTAPLRILKGNLKYYLLVTILVAALFNMNLAGILTLWRSSCGLSHSPSILWWGWLFREGWTGLYGYLGDYMDDAQPGYSLLKEYLLPFRTTFYPLAFMSLLFFVGIVLMERFERRTGAAICARWHPPGGLPQGIPSSEGFRRGCARIAESAETIAPRLSMRQILQKSDCILCLDCQRKCKHDRIVFRPALAQPQPFRHGRRVFLTGLAGGILASKLFVARTPVAGSPLLRPPGAQDENGSPRRSASGAENA